MNPSCYRLGTRSQIAWALHAVMAIAILILGAADLRAATVTAMWDANTEPDIASYILSYGTQSGAPYANSVNVGNVTSWPLNLSPGRYYFVIQARNTSGQTSPMSPEVIADVGAPPTPFISSLSPTSGSAEPLCFSQLWDDAARAIQRHDGEHGDWGSTSIVAFVGRRDDRQRCGHGRGMAATV